MNTKTSANAEAKDGKTVGGPKGTPRLLEKYNAIVLPWLAKELGRTNKLSLPRLLKITINQGVGIAMQDKKHIEVASEALGLIAGQKPLVTRARLSVAGFKLREGVAIGVKVDLRGRRMWEFLDRLISVALPRVRDFRGISARGFDGHGNFSMGLSEQLVFPELNPDRYTRVQGMNITFGVKNATNEESLKLLTYLGMPFAIEEAKYHPTKQRAARKRQAAYVGTADKPITSLQKPDWIPAKVIASLYSLSDAEPIAVANKWTDEKSIRRAELIEKEYRDKLSPKELSELEALQDEFGDYQDLIAPLPLDEELDD